MGYHGFWCPGTVINPGVSLLDTTSVWCPGTVINPGVSLQDTIYSSCNSKFLFSFLFIWKSCRASIQTLDHGRRWAHKSGSVFVFFFPPKWLDFVRQTFRFPLIFFGGLVDVFSVVVFLGFFIWGRGEQSLTSFDPLRGVCVCVNPWNIGIGTHMRTFRSTAGGHGSIHQSVANEATDVWRGYAVWSTARTCYRFFFMFSVLGMTGVMVRNMLYVRLYSPRLCSTN